MASSAWSLHYHYISPCLNKRAGGGLLHFPLNTANPKRQQQPLRRLQMQLQNQEEIKEDHGHDHAASTRRRQFMLQAPLISISFSQLITSNALAVAEIDVPQDFRDYTDEVNKYKILIPQGWQVGAGEPNSFKSITAFYPEEAANSNVSVAISGLGPDFTRMESFGKVEAFADTLVSGLDRSWQRPPGVAAKLIDCKAANGMYYIEYTLQNPGESQRHLFTAIGMATNGWYNRLYTVTGQYVEEEAEKYGSRIEKAVSSFRFI
ncbi:hypothetical protein like AT1G76450 [Hibiscus trionum]|uniref:PsbP C-terminal domain-containing protein n=1 Tax=Hibiscus trionum TaxID=183268 RepID=A0A9W7MHT2_HIBTR|nr:hypothetical protein like AT1G76450 [Hibiscus trionum]